MLGWALAYAWASYPYALFALQTNANDGLVAMTTVLAMLALVSVPARRGLSGMGRGLAVGAGAAAKFAPLALAPLMAGGLGRDREGPRAPLVVLVVLVLVVAAAVLPFVPDGGPGRAV
jgi:hypothetical protein